MRRSLALALFFFLAAFTARAAQHGAWRLTARDDGRMQIDLVSDHNHNSHGIEPKTFALRSASRGRSSGPLIMVPPFSH